MVSLDLILVAFFILPFLLAFVHTRFFHREEGALVYYRYFAFANISVAGAIVAGRMLRMGHDSAIFQLYGLAIFSMVLLSILTLFRRDSLRLASALVWAIFILMSSVSHGLQIWHHVATGVHALLTHVIYNVLVACVLFYYYFRLQFSNRGSLTYFNLKQP